MSQLALLRAPLFSPSNREIPLRERLRLALVITRRELRDSLRDWRIMTPIVILTLLFPFLMDFTAGMARDFVLRYGGQNALIAERLNPFLLMIVGFFPVTFSLVLALETFVGEKERGSLEPLLSMPISDGELYLGKMLAALALPLAASYLAISVYLTGMVFSSGWLPDSLMLLQMLLLNSMKASVMVSAAVIASSQTSSVRAANLLASFIIIPMALLVQGESILLFWGQYDVLWWIIAALCVADLILVRMGIRIFNREEILAREMDELNLGRVLRDFAGYFLRPPEQALQRGVHPSPNLWRMLCHDIPYLLRAHWQPLGVVLLTLAGAIALGISLAAQWPLPEGAIRLEALSQDTFEQVPQLGFLPRFSISGVFFNNLRALVLAGVLAIFSFGVMPLVLLMAPLALVGFFAAQVAALGYNPWIFVGTFILPHGIVELPAAIIATGFALRVGAALVSPPSGLDVGQGFLLVLADFLKVFLLLVLPLLFLAAVLEVEVTPQVVLAVYGMRP
ncbi:MAG: stage II sporulation protein M [Anaerolineae bacterium]